MKRKVEQQAEPSVTAMLADAMDSDLTLEQFLTNYTENLKEVIVKLPWSVKLPKGNHCICKGRE